jgi:cell division protein FtsB
VNSKRTGFWKVPLIIIAVLGLIVAWLGFGKHGLFHLYNTEMERQAHVDRIRRLAAENQALIEEINRLRTDMGYIEAVARKELNLIRQNELIYRFNKEKTSHNNIKPIQK